MEGTPISTGKNWNKQSIFPVIGEPLRAENALSLDFIAANGPLQEVGLSDTAAFDAFVFKKLQGIREADGYGGYLEKRGIYRRSEVFAKAQEDFLNILLGNRPMDSWQLRFCTSDGAIHSFQDNVDF